MLSTIIEYLAAQGLGRPGRAQFIIPIFPAFSEVYFSVIPPFGVYAAIKYAYSFQALPSAIYLEVSQAGNKYVQGTLEADHMRELLPYWIVYSERDPISTTVRNVTPVNQAFIGTQYMLLIDTDTILAQAKKDLAAFSVSQSIEIAKQTNTLLDAISRQLALLK